MGYVGLGGLCRGGVGYVEVGWVLHFFQFTFNLLCMTQNSRNINS